MSPTTKDHAVGLQLGELLIDLPDGTFYAVGSVGRGWESGGDELKLLLEALHMGVALLLDVKDQSSLSIQWLQSPLNTRILVHLGTSVGGYGYKTTALAVLDE